MHNNIIWHDENTPMSIHFNDVYFNDDNALAETSYVFIDGNQLRQRFINHQQADFFVGETGFGSGLNFLMLWLSFLLFRQQNPDHILKKLHFISIEKYPLSSDELALIHQRLFTEPMLIQLSKQLLQQWQTVINEREERFFSFGDVFLTVFISDIEYFSAKITQKMTINYVNPKPEIIDAWFFDGFSPAKNPEMWSEKLFKSLFDVSKQNCSFSTFTSASFVRKNLMNAGFSVQKRKGYGKKREMLIGYKENNFG